MTMGRSTPDPDIRLVGEGRWVAWSSRWPDLCDDCREWIDERQRRAEGKSLAAIRAAFRDAGLKEKLCGVQEHWRKTFR